MLRTLEWTTNSGIAMGLHFLTCFPTESKSDYIETLINFYDIFQKGYLKNKNSYIWVHSLVLDPGTHLYLNPNEYGLKIKRRKPDDVSNLIDYSWTSKEVDRFDKTFRVQMLQYLYYELREMPVLNKPQISGILTIVDSIKTLSKSIYGEKRIQLFENLYNRLLLIYASSIISGKSLRNIFSDESVRNGVLQSLMLNN